MADYEKFLPEIPELHAPFWESIRQESVRLQKCDECGRFRFIPSERCPCGSTAATWTPIAGTGEVYAFTVIHRAPTPAYQAEVPYVIAHVTIDEGPRMIATVVDCEPDDVHIGMPVRLVYDHVTPEVSLYRFAPA